MKIIKLEGRYRNKCRIYIPSTGRHDVNMTFLALPFEWRRNLTIVVNEGELKKYQSSFPSYVEIVEADGCENIGQVRQWIIDNTEAKYILMMDDDLRFARRAVPGKLKLVPCNQSDVGHILRTLFDYLMKERYVHVSLCKRTEASFFLCSYRTVARQNNVHGFRVENIRSLRKKGVRFDKLDLMEDFHVTLRLFELGYPNKILFDYTWDQRGSNMAGGCSTYRTRKRQRLAAKALKKLHPDVVEVVKKKVRGHTSWNNMKTRTDVRIAWRKAYTGKEDPHWKIERESVRK